MPIRAQCNNCGKVYNVPDESAGKRLRCKQCAVVFSVPSAAAPVAAAAPTVSVSVPAVQKMCVVCGQDVAGKPRTKDQAGNYYCRACYEQKARSREQLAASRVGEPVPAGVGAGEGGGGDMIDLAALEGVEVGEQFDYSAQPPPPPIPDMDMVAPPIPDMEPQVIEAPRPKKKKKKKPAVAAKAASGESFASKLLAFPIELYIVAVCVLLGILGAASSTLSGFAFIGLVLIGLGVAFWGKICIVMAAFAEGTMTGIMYMFVPFYWLIFLLGNWADLQRHILRVAMGIAIIIGAGIFIARHGDDGDGDEDARPRTRSRAARVARDDESAATDDSSAARLKPDRTAAAPPAEEPIVVGVNLKEFELELDDDVLEKLEDDITDAILTSFEQRGIKPPEGKLYRVEAMVEPNLSATQKVKNAQLEDIPAPVLLCKLRVKTSVGRGEYIFEQAKESALPAEMGATFYRLEQEAIDKLLWKNVPRQFKALADMFAPAGTAATPTTQPAASNAPPAPAK